MQAMYRTIWLIAIILCSLSAQAETLPEFPAVCAQRILETNVLNIDLDVEFTKRNFDRSTLQQSGLLDRTIIKIVQEEMRATSVGNRMVRYQSIAKQYQQTLDEIEGQLRNNQSPLFKHLQECNWDERECHGYFMPSNELHTRIYCDREIYRYIINAMLNDRIPKIQACADQPFNEISVSVLNELTDVKYSPQCFFKDHDGSNVYLKNKAPQYIKDVRFLYTQYENLVQMSEASIAKSVMPEAKRFILRKAVEEFEYEDLREAKIAEVNHYYHTQDLIHSFEQCCDNSTLLQEYQVSADVLKQEADNIRNNGLYTSQALVFTVQDPVTQMLLDRAEAYYWQNYQLSTSPQDMPLRNRKAYFAFLEKDPFVFHQDRTAQNFQDEIQDLDVNGRQAYLTARQQKAPPSYQMHKDPAWQQYQQSMGYQSPMPIGEQVIYAPDSALVYNINYPDISQVFSEQQVLNQFLFNPKFRDYYSTQLTEQLEEQDEAILTMREKNVFSKMFHGFLPYQFVKTQKAMLLRELQKMGKQHIDAQNLRTSREDFVSWAVAYSCQGYEHSFCKPSQKPFIEKKMFLFFDEIWDNPDYHYVYQRKLPTSYVYGWQFAGELKKDIQNINQFCFNQYPQKMNTLEQQRATQGAYQDEFDQLMQGFLSKPGMQNLLVEESFFDLIDFEPTKAFYNCMTQGAVFGSVSESMTAIGGRISAGFSQGADQHALKTMQTLTKEQRWNQPTITFDLSDLQDIEDDIVDTLKGELKKLNSALSYSRHEQIQEFLAESVAYRIFALLEYAKDHPSGDIGKQICRLIALENDNAVFKQQMRTAAIYGALIVASVAAVAVLPVMLPALLKGTVLVFSAETATATLFIGLSGAITAFEITQVRYKMKMVSTSALTQNMETQTAMMFLEGYAEEKSTYWNMLIMDLALEVVLLTKPFKLLKQYLWTKEDAIKKIRLKDQKLEFEKALEAVAHREGVISYSRRVRNKLFSDQVTDEQRKQFIRALRKGDDLFFLNNDLAHVFGQVHALERIPKKISSADQLSEYVRKATRGIDKVAQLIDPSKIPAGKKYGYLESAWRQFVYGSAPKRAAMHLQVKRFTNGFIHLFKKGPRSFKAEQRMVDLLEKIRGYQNQYRYVEPVVHETEIKNIVAQMKHFGMHADGTIYRKEFQRIENLLNQFVQKVSAGNHGIKSETIYEYLKPLFHKSIISEKHIELILSQAKFTIKNIEDCEKILKIVKFAKKTDADKVYAQINEFFDLATFTKARDSYRSVEAFEKIMAEYHLSPKQFTEMVQVHAEKFTVVQKINRKSAYKKIIDDFDETVALSKKYQKQFMHEEKQLNDHFLTQLNKEIAQLAGQSPDKLGLAVYKALVHTKARKSVLNECHRPDSIVRANTNKAYAKYSLSLGLATNVQAYMMNHYDEGEGDFLLGKNGEWWGRTLYEVVIPYFITKLKVNIFTAEGKGHFSKIMADYGTGTFFNGVSTPIYNATNRTFWETQESMEENFAEMIYESEDVQAKVNAFFKEYPDIQAHLDHQIELLMEVLKEINIRKNIGQIHESEMEELFIKNGLIDRIFNTDPGDSPSLEDDPMSKMLMEEGYIDKDYFVEPETQEQMRDRILEALTEIEYLEAYKNRSETMYVPFYGDLYLGTWDYEGFKLGTTDFVKSASPFLDGASSDRFVYYLGNDALMAAPSYGKNILIYKALCNGRFGNYNLLNALMIHVAWKQFKDLTGYRWREQATGR